MKKYRLLRDLPFAKAGEIVSEEYWLDYFVAYKFVQQTDWFEEVKERWEPKNSVCWVSVVGEVKKEEVNNICLLQRMIDFGNYFRTREQAEEAAKRIKKVLDEYHAEIGE